MIVEFETTHHYSLVFFSVDCHWVRGGVGVQLHRYRLTLVGDFLYVTFWVFFSDSSVSTMKTRILECLRMLDDV